MGLGNLFGKWGICPECRQRGAKMFVGSVKCPNPKCRKYDPQLIVPPEALNYQGPAAKPLNGDFNPGANSLRVQYRNHLGYDGSYEVDNTTINANGDSFSAKAVPTGKRVSFKKRFVKNLSEVEGAINQEIEAQLSESSRGDMITVKYRSFAGKDLEFTGYAGTIRKEGERISLLVKRSGTMSSLKIANIQNLSEIERYIPK